ncbi:MAG: carboxyltransferase domain-containing protein [Saprospiraceae bacterium]
MAPKIFPLSETALLVQWSEHIENALHQKVLDLNHLLCQMLFADFVETTLAYTSLAVYYQLERIESEGESPFQYVKSHLEALLGNEIAQVSQPKNLVSIPVCYDERYLGRAGLRTEVALGQNSICFQAYLFSDKLYPTNVLI